MDLLLDTNIFIWWKHENPRLAPRFADMISDPANRVFVSTVTVWEVAIKRRTGKLAFTGSLTDSLAQSGFIDVPILSIDAEAAGDLAWNHKDPFDRLLAVQTIRLGAILLTSDETLSQGPAPTIWTG